MSVNTYTKDDLNKAVAAGSLDSVKQILVTDPNLIDAESFFAAARQGNFEIVKWLVEYSRISLNEYDGSHRNVLHYAAMSGNFETFVYLVDKCGMDPLEGDAFLLTPWDIVHEDHKKDTSQIEHYLEERYRCRYTQFYRNPVRSGFFPDPSICRVGSDYYMVNSSFIFFPCIPISHSTDLVHWEVIGHAITDTSTELLEKLEGGRGFWAPDISYYEGRFCITATYRLNDVPPVYRRQMVVSSDKPEGPYTDPVFIDEDGIDPSIFNDDDGRRYMLLNRGARIFELDKSGTKKISEARLLFYGDHKRAPEGPHLYKKDGYYYLLEAEGGTGPGHRVTVSRSKELFGNYEPCPFNPIMRQEDEGAAIQRCGHGDLVETEDGRWYMVYLCGRMIGDGYSILGRETALDPVTWTKDGWPMVNDLKGPSAMQVLPYPDRCASLPGTDHDPDAGANEGSYKLSPCGLFMDYMTPRAFRDGDVRCFTKMDGDHSFRVFDIVGSRAPLEKVESRNIVLRRQTSFKFRYEVTLDIPELSNGQCAGITGYYDENTFFEFGVISFEKELYIYSREHIGDEDRIRRGEKPLSSLTKSIRFAMDTDYLKRELKYRSLTEDEDGEGHGDVFESFTILDNVYYLCDEGLKKGKRFTGALVGLYAYRGESDLKVRFHHDNYRDER
jgi:xylan 1,4-beta-xylosidase